jgi:hypothetical protein
MAGPDAPDAGERRWRVGRRWALVAWAVFGVVVWNVVFDAGVIRAGRDYLTRQALHQQGRGPAITIRQIMTPGVATAARRATVSGASILAIGVLGVWAAGRRRRAGPLPPGSE